MPYTPSTVPDNVPKKYAAQFSEVWNSAYAAAIADKKSPAQAEETAFAQAHGVILKAKQKDDRAITLQDGPGFGRDSSGGGQVADPTQSMRYSDDQPRDEHGKFGAGSEPVHAGHHEILKDAGYHQTTKKGEYKNEKGDRVRVAKNGAFTRIPSDYSLKVGVTADDLKDALK